MNRFAVLVPVCALGLSACAGTDMLSFLQSGSYKQATIVPDPPQPTKIVQVVQPVALPGQLQHLSKHNSHRGNKAPTAQVDAANLAALQEPTSDGYINAIQVYPYSEGALYRLYAAPQEVTDIALQPGENLIAISAGDTTRWVVGDTSSGSGASKQVHILAKPIAANLHTNLVITTDRRSYHLQLESTDRTYMAALSWTYPQDGLIAMTGSPISALPPASFGAGTSLDNLHFDYTIEGDNPPWKPVRAFDDGTHVYIEFPKTLAVGDAPPLFIKGADGGHDLVNYRVRGNYYIVDQLFAEAELRMGQDDQQVVRIERTGKLRTADTGAQSH